jgi:[acyl-carrier-protein] S-malonyltransferase
MAEVGKRWAALFPGQGSQKVGMGSALAAASPLAAAVFDRADAAIGEPLSKLCAEGPEEELRLTRNTQPALLTVSIAAWEALRPHLDADPVAAAGHSLGEYSALVAAGALGFEDAVRAVRLRGEAMQEAVPVGEGAMAAVLGLDAAAVEALCVDTRQGDEALVAANFNAPDQIVVAGTREAVQRLTERAPEAGAKRVVELPVSAPFHSPLMSPAAEKMAAFLETVAFSDPSFPVVANADARPVTSGAEAKQKLVEQIASPVRWVESLKWLESSGEVEIGVEIGCGKVLAGLARKTCRTMKVSTFEDMDDLERVLERLKRES